MTYSSHIFGQSKAGVVKEEEGEWFARYQAYHYHADLKTFEAGKFSKEELQKFYQCLGAYGKKLCPKQMAHLEVEAAEIHQKIQTLIEKLLPETK